MTAQTFRIRITRRNGVKVFVPDCSFLLRDSAEMYAAKYIPAFQQPEIVDISMTDRNINSARRLLSSAQKWCD